MFVVKFLRFELKLHIWRCNWFKVLKNIMDLAPIFVHIADYLPPALRMF